MKHLALVLLAVAACGTDSAPASPDAPPSAEPVYYGQVERILRDSCVECHAAAADRIAPFSLASYADARDAAETAPMAFAVMNRTMPPFYANDDECQPIHASKWLADEDLDTLVRWINGSRLEGDPSATVGSGPALEHLTAAEIDRTLDIGVDYQLDPTQDDDYQCFVVPALGANAVLTAIEVRPSNPTVAHHVVVYTLANAAAEADVVARDQADPRPGYECAGAITSDDGGSSFLMGWAPGQAATRFPAGTGIAIDGARKLVIQMHYNKSHGDGRPDRTKIDLSLASSVQSQAAVISVKGNVDLPPREVDATATGTRTLQLPGNLTNARIWGAMMHMHHRGTGAEVTVERTAPACALDLDGWSFHWQHFYWFDGALPVAANETLRVTCHYDTSNDATNVRWGEGTDQEMCLAYLYVSQ